MNKTEPFSATTDTDLPKDWRLLFDMLPEIRQTKRFGKLVGSKKMPDGNLSLPFWLEDEIVSKFFNAAYFLGIVKVFDWAAWQEGIDILNDPAANFSGYDIETLCKLITLIVRSDKFCEGYMINAFETGTMVRIIEALKNKIEGNLNF
jgi:hypothetical protein